MSAQPKCTCKTKDSYIAAKSHITEVDDEGICIHCGYYAIWDSDHNLFPKSNSGIHGYKKVSRRHKPGWTQAEIDNYFSYIDCDHEHFAIHSGKLNMDYSGKGTGSRKSRRKKKSVVNKEFNRRTHL